MNEDQLQDCFEKQQLVIDALQQRLEWLESMFVLYEMKLVRLAKEVHKDTPSIYRFKELA